MMMHNYSVAWEIVHEINNCFGWISLLFSIIGFINKSFEVFVSLDFEDALFVFNYVINFTAMCYTTDSIRHEVR